jgi:hypothetical protein
MANKKSTYIHETHHLCCYDGEMHIGYGEDKWLVYNAEQLIKDLPFIISEVIRENKKQQRMYISLIKEQLEEL